MNKRAAITSLILAFLVIAFGSRWYLDRIDVKAQVVTSLAQSLPGTTSIESVFWRILPTPALTIKGLKTDSDGFALSVPQINLIIDPTFFVTGTISLLRAQLVDPEIIVREFAFPSGMSAKARRTSPLLCKISIKNGRVSFPGQAMANGIILEPATMTGINGTFSSQAERAEFTVTATPSFAQLLHINGKIDRSAGTYEGDISAAGLDSNRLLSPHSSYGFLPQFSSLSFTSHLEGVGANHLSVRVTSRNTPFLVQESSQALAVKAIDGLWSRHNNNVAIEINELALTDPKLSLSGRISRQQPGNGATSPPQWSLDLTGTAIDLAAVRKELLKRFPANPVAAKVCNIVRGGSATTARYVFTGALADFHHITSMQIWAEAKDVPIVVPGIELTLDRASGPISILDGRLTGTGLSADIDKSHGENGTLLVDLRHGQHDFTLDLDLTADLGNLQNVLTQVVPSPRFQKELNRFSQVSGLATGHLHLGDDLRHVKTDVDVVSMEAKGRYNRLPWPFAISSGSLTVAPQQVEWDGLAGTIGKHRINRSQGSVDWYDGIEIDLDSLEADLDLGTLFAEGSVIRNADTIAFKELLKGRVEALAGKAHISQTTFSGYLNQKERWRFHSRASASALRIDRPNLPAIASKNAQAEIDQEHVGFTGIFSLFEQELFLVGNYTHTLFDRWRGKLTVDGDVGPMLGDYLQQRHPIPSAIFPKVPFRLEKFTISSPVREDQPFSAQGTIISLTPGSKAKAQVNIDRTPEESNETITFIDGADTGTLSYQAWPAQEGRSLFTWQGDLNVATLDALIPQKILLAGAVHGAFTRVADNRSAVYNGGVVLDGIRFAPESLIPDLKIDKLGVSGDSHAMHIDQAALSLGNDAIKIDGNFSDEMGRRNLDLHFTTAHLSSKSLQKALDYLKEKDGHGEPSPLRKSFSGTIGFAIDTFDYQRQPSAEEVASNPPTHTISVSPVSGVITVRPATFDLAIDRANVCGLQAKGLWHSGKDASENAISFWSGKSPVYFEQTLPCLGFNQSLIVGPFRVNGAIKGRPQHWRQGTITLTSETGLIKRMNLLSKIFTAVNFTDYFTWQDMPNVDTEGLAYNEMSITAHIADNRLDLDRTVIKGKGVNLSGRGTIDLGSYDSDLTFFIAPFKMVDSIVTGIPLIGKAIGGPKESILTFPVKVTGNIKSPEVTSLAPEALGTAAWEMIRDTLTLPFRIFQPSEK